MTKKKQGGKLTSKQIEAFRQQLLDMRDEVLQRVRGSAETVKQHGESIGQTRDHSDGGADDFDREIFLGLNHKENDLLRQIERALEKMDEGTYGICDLSAEPISLARLKAMPYACFTVAAQSQLEEKQRSKRK